VWGMPGAIASAGLATSILPLPQVAPAILRSLSRGVGQTAPATAGGRA
jgi:two-component system, chemotaxis family, protein-glutamate methylesterase/glutaminase